MDVCCLTMSIALTMSIDLGAVFRVNRVKWSQTLIHILRNSICNGQDPFRRVSTLLICSLLSFMYLLASLEILFRGAENENLGD